MPRNLTKAEREQFLADKHVAVLSVAAEDGRPPSSVPIWYDYTSDGLIRINTGAGSRKAKLIQQAGVVSLVVQREEPPYQYVIVEGSVVDTVIPAPDDAREEIAVRYLGEEAGREFVRSMAGVATVLFAVRPDRWLTADFSDEV